MSRKLTKETYKKDESDAKSVQMWVTKKVFFYQEFNVQVEGNLHGGNMLFIIGI
jgi:acyl-CoA hydrolase